MNIITDSQDFWPGQACPDFLVTSPGETPATFYERYCGKKTVLVFPLPGEPLPCLEALRQQAQLLIVYPASNPGPIAPGVAGVVDDGAIAESLLGQPPSDLPRAVLLRDTLAVDSVLQGLRIPDILSALQRIPETAPSRVCTGFAPILMVPDVLSRPVCQRLIAAHDANNHESGMLREVDGRVALRADPETKKRRDHQLTQDDLVQSVTDALIERLLPLVRKSFHYEVTRMEGFKVVAYDSKGGGYFRLHRDSVTPDARHRRFALSLNLNSDYEGGELVFPEFGSCRYRPPEGGALVFSGAHLHGACDVTAGRRYVLLTFLWGDDVV